MSVERQLHAAAASVRSYGAVAVVGAGVSAARYPMAAQLPPLVWHALDQVPAARRALAAELRIADASAKTLIADNPASLTMAWRVLEEHPAAQMVFQEAFARLDADRDATPAHYALARLINAGVVEYVVSFNWDTAIERAYEQLFGTPVPPGWLVKPHGDASAPSDAWVLPHQPGRIPDDLQERIAALVADRPRVLLQIGYSGSDPQVVLQLITPTADRWQVFRISPSATGVEAITGTADDVLPALADILGAAGDLDGWRYVIFDRFRDLRSALRGYRLGPQDVKACPRLPAVAGLVSRLCQTQFAVLDGDSGAGKSITAFQAAHDLNRDGWTVVELSQPGAASLVTVHSFTRVPGPVLAVVDDAQALPADVLQQFGRVVSHDHAVLLVATDRAPGQEVVRVASQHAVDLLRRYCAENAHIVAPLVSEIDDSVGVGIARESFASRLRATQDATYPWQFMSILSGVERRIGETISNLAASGDADVLLGILAARQLLSLDAGVAPDTLRSDAGTLNISETACDVALEVLAEHRVLIRRDDRLRSPHMRIADRTLVALATDLTGNKRDRLLTFLRTALRDTSIPLQGRLWLLNTLHGSDSLRLRRRGVLIDDPVAEDLVDECLAAPRGEQRNVAGYVLWELTFWRALTSHTVSKIGDELPDWIREVTAADVWGVKRLLGGLRNGHDEVHEHVRTQVSPHEIGRRLNDHGTPIRGEAWGQLINELAPDERHAAEGWFTEFTAIIDHTKIATWAATATTPHELRGLAELSGDLGFPAPTVATTIIETMSSALAALIETNIATAASCLTQWGFSILLLERTQSDELWASRPDYRRLRDAVRRLFGCINWQAAGHNLTRDATLDDMDALDVLTHGLAQINPDAYQQFASAVSLDDLDRLTTADDWRAMTGIESVAIALSHNADREPARTWISRHSNQIRAMPDTYVPIAPDVAVDILTRGDEIRLIEGNAIRWDDAAAAIDALRDISRDHAVTVVAGARDALLDNLTLRHTGMIDGLQQFIDAVDRIDPALLNDLLNNLEPGTTRAHWSAAVTNTRDDVAAAAHALITRARALQGPIGELARHLDEQRTDQLAANRQHV